MSLDQPGVDAEHAGDKASNMAILDAITQKVCASRQLPPACQIAWQVYWIGPL